MVYTEVKKKNGSTYYYRVISIRKGKSVQKKRVYLGANLSGNILLIKVRQADKELVPNKELEKLIPTIKKILLKHHIKRAGVFGSYAEGKQRKTSDIDILVEPPPGIGFGFAGIGIELEEKLKRKVDLVSYNGLSPYLKENILKQQVKIL